ncbi:MAG: lipoprotein-releasing ABC transporter ATP-binding protein LolD [Proteobacteria bacterium]|jgi:lipoprotein-releasing system ATP-binding protein|nr:lipoprotein-releasing ABC transporter ATP-binding protein LolD [Pseudomonadota bacterium]MDA0927437.1 lipoprotein-releasing ABC transporter ATP-binding protein LolD [Pseudomonadota bacterium]
MNKQEPVLACTDLVKTYSQGPQVVEVLQGINLEVAPGERIAIVGSSGSGKTTLLNMLGGLDLPTSGTVKVAGKNLAEVNETERGMLRNRHLGFVYQFHHLLGEFTALENVAMPLLIAGLDKLTVNRRSEAMLGRVGLAARVSHKPAELSGGERQRVAIARALVTEPQCVLLDEPTGNLDGRTAREVQALMTELNKELGISFVIVTHDEQLADSMERKLELRDGKLHEQTL